MEIKKYKTVFGENKLPTLLAESSTEYKKDSIDSPKSVAEMLRVVFCHHLETEEIMYLVCLNTKNSIIGVFEISHGTVNRALISPREIFMKALTCGAVSLILAHNHPSGDSEPSLEDIKLTKRIDEVGKLIDIQLIDHIVICEDSFASLKQRQLF